MYLSNGGHSEYSHGIAMLYSKGMLEFVFRKTNGEEWRVNADNVLTNRWYHIAATWIQRDGLFLYVNGNLVDKARRPTRKSPAVNRDQNDHFVIGRGNDHSGLNDMGTLLVDELHFWSTFKSAKEIRESGMCVNMVWGNLSIYNNFFMKNVLFVRWWSNSHLSLLFNYGVYVDIILLWKCTISLLSNSLSDS